MLLLTPRMIVSRLALTLSLLMVYLPGQAALEITITGGGTGALPIAVVPFASLPDESYDIAAIVESDLNRSGLFKPLARQDMLETPSSPEQIDWRNWRALGVEHLVIGQLRRADTGGMVVRFQLMDVFRARQVLGYDLPVNLSLIHI